MVNYSTTPGISANDILRYVSACFSIFCEYFVNTSSRVRNAAFSALRIILSHSLKKEFFRNNQSQNNLAAEILSLDVLSLNDQMMNMMREGKSS